MELRQLAYLVEIVEKGGFTRAAEALHVAQPGVSAQVAALERELGQRLFDRSTREVRLTTAGRMLLPFARRALDEVRGLQEAADELTGLVRGRAVAGLVTGGATVDAAETLAAFARRYPGVEVSLTEASTDELVAQLRGGRVDLAWLALGGQDPEGLRTRVLSRERLVAVVATDDPLASRKQIDLTVLADRSIVCSPLGTGVRTALEDAGSAAGFRPLVTSEAGAPYLLARMAAGGLGVAVVPASAAASAAAAGVALHVLTITRPALHGRIALAWRADGPDGTAGRALLAHVLRTS